MQFQQYFSAYKQVSSLLLSFPFLRVSFQPLVFSQHFGFRLLSKMLIQRFLYLIGKDFCLFTTPPPFFFLNQHHCLHYSHHIFYPFLKRMVSCAYITILRTSCLGFIYTSFNSSRIVPISLQSSSLVSLSHSQCSKEQQILCFFNLDYLFVI